MKILFSFVCLFAFSAVVFSVSSEEESKIVETCKKQTKASSDDVKVIEELNELPKTRTQFCLLACYSKAIGSMDANNKLIYEESMKEIEPIKKENKELYDKLEKVTKLCISETTPNKTDECDSMKKYTECMLKKGKEMGIDY